MNINLRLETPADYHAVEALTREAFWQFWSEEQQICDEHLLVHRLRNVAAFVPELNYVAEISGQIVGHIIYTKSRIEDNSGQTYETLTFGPLTVSPEFQNRGIGQALMLHTFDEARHLGYRAVLIFGYPDYYPRVGFRRAAEFDITTAAGETFDPFMVYPLYDGALEGVQGRYYIDPVYESLTQEDALAFDKQFPPKQPHIPSLINVLLDRLEPHAAEAIQGLGFRNLEMLKSKSEREISSLPGMNANAVETIRAVMQEHGFRWGI
ncbi:MAG: N-acetyltransferase [Oscillospiraceae bacterium]|nr:N-acetyltransferase [Oscillospiraceae bacterium]